MDKKHIAIFGSTGSIGRQTLDVVRQHPDLFEVELLTANNSWERLSQQAREFGAKAAVICNRDFFQDTQNALEGSGTAVYAGIDEACRLVSGENIDMVVIALVGFSGLRPSIAAIEAGKTLALANKETLVTAGGLVMDLVKRKGIRLLPIDSEHSAIFQCLQGSEGNKISKIHLTASGGPFRTWSKEEIAKATKDQALRHPHWSMGAKITIDSATMMNKGFEMIEAKWLFDMAPEKINIIIQPQSVIHSMIEFEDGSVIAQLACPDMREPIQYALAYPQRLPLESKRLDFAQLGSLTFEKPDYEKFPALGLAFEATKRGGNIPCAMNAANEAAVAAYLNDRISFYQIPAIVEHCMDLTSFVKEPGLTEILATNNEIFAKAKELINKV